MTSELPSDAFGAAPSAPPPSARDAVKHRVLEASLGVGSGATVLLDGRYRLGREIGRGGTGAVWEGTLEPLGRPVAIKFLRTSTFERDREAGERMLREARALASIDHPQIVKVFDAGTDADGRPFIVMERLEGRPLSEVLAARGALGPEAAIEIGLEVCLALSEAHRLGLVHRDVKPANLVVLHEGAPWRCKLLDFGLCKELGPMAIDGETASRAIVGTPGYLAPEQACGDRVDRRADVYGLGCLLYEVLVGRPTFSDRRTAVLLASQLRGRTLRAEVDHGIMDQAWADLLEQTLQVAPEARPADVDTVARALRSLKVRASATHPSKDRRRVPHLVVSVVAVAVLSSTWGLVRRDGASPDASALVARVGGEFLHELVPARASPRSVLPRGFVVAPEATQGSAPGAVSALASEDAPGPALDGAVAAGPASRPVVLPPARGERRTRARSSARLTPEGLEVASTSISRAPTPPPSTRVLAPGIRDPFDVSRSIALEEVPRQGR